MDVLVNGIKYVIGLLVETGFRGDQYSKRNFSPDMISFYGERGRLSEIGHPGEISLPR